jgi:hypothetical protein
MSNNDEPKNLDGQEHNEDINPPKLRDFGISDPDKVNREVSKEGNVSWKRFSTKDTLAYITLGSVVFLASLAIVTGNLAIFVGILAASGLSTGLKRIYAHLYPESASRMRLAEMWFELQKLKIEKRGGASKHGGEKGQS